MGRLPEHVTADDRGARWLRRVAVLNLVVQIAIVVTGGIVRLTGSGLGCPTWPECAPGSLVPTAEQEEGTAKIIEFGNRLLTFVVGIAALALLVLALRYRRRLALAAALPLLGTIAQAVLGGITVLTRLHPATVAAHFLLSMLLIAASTMLLYRLGEVDGPVGRRLSAPLRGLAYGLAGMGAVAVILGTVVTGAGPHAGDADEAVRFAVDIRTVSTLHAEAVVAFCGLLIGYLVALAASGVASSNRGALRAARLVLVITLAQGALGYVQYFTGVPRLLVGIHMLGAALFVCALTVLLASTRSRGPVAP